MKIISSDNEDNNGDIKARSQPKSVLLKNVKSIFSEW